MTAVRAEKSPFSDDWQIQQEITCINGLRCWFAIATVCEPDAAEMGYTDGAIGTAEERAKRIADALNKSIAKAEAPADAEGGER